MQEIKSVGVISLARFDGVITGIIGLIVGIFYLIFKSIEGYNNYDFWNGVSSGLIGLGIIPLAYAALGFATGALGALLYNYLAKNYGGIKIRLD